MKGALPILRLAAMVRVLLLAPTFVVLVRASMAIHPETTDAARVCTSSSKEGSCVDKSKLNENEEEEEEKPLDEEPLDDETGRTIRHDDPSYGCRRKPTWNGGETDPGLRDHCQRVLGYKPDLEALMEEFGEEEEHHHPMIHNFQDLPPLERPLIVQLANCLETHIANATTTTTPPNVPIRKATLAKLYHREDGLPMAAIVEDALSEQEAEGVLGLAGCLQTHVPRNFVQRNFQNTYQGSGNDVTFLSGFLQVLLPGVAASIHQTAHLVWTEAEWGEYPAQWEPIDAYQEDFISNYSSAWWPNPITECGIRTTEHLSYDRWKGLGFHEDHGSDYTVLVALSDPSDYEGGEFSICPEDDDDEDDGDCPNKISIKVPKRSAVVFLSEFHHGVEDIHSSGRVMFANELWRYGDCPVLSKRPTEEEHVLGIVDLDDDDEDDVDEDDNEDEYDNEGYHKDNDIHDDEEEDEEIIGNVEEEDTN